MLTFEPTEHVYQWDGQTVPSVTQVLNQWVLPKGAAYYINTFTGDTVPADVFEAAQEAGSAIHKGAAYILQGQGIDWNALAPELAEPLRQLEEWIRLFRVEPLYVEEPMFSPALGVAGTPDLLCRLTGDKNIIALVDIKTGLINDMVGPQTAAYERLVRDGKKLRQIIKRYSLVLPRDGSPFKFEQLADARDFAFFAARQTQFNYFRR